MNDPLELVNIYQVHKQLPSTPHAVTISVQAQQFAIFFTSVRFHHTTIWWKSFFVINPTNNESVKKWQERDFATIRSLHSPTAARISIKQFSLSYHCAVGRHSLISLTSHFFFSNTRLEAVNGWDAFADVGFRLTDWIALKAAAQ